MRKLVLILCSILLAASDASAETTMLQITRSDDGESFAKWERHGVRYITYDESVLDAIDKLVESKRDVSRGHAALGRKHAELGREHAALGREQARLSREKRHRDVEADIARIERKRDDLDERRRDLESERRRLEQRRDAASKDIDDKLDELFERAVRYGRAKRL